MYDKTKETLMGRTRLALAGGIAAIATSALIATTGLAQAPDRTSLHLVATVQEGVGFQPKHELRRGDQFGFGETITGDDTGIDRGACTVIANTESLCTVGLRLSKGTLSAQSVVSLNSRPGSKTLWAVTGGTGAYDGARGTAVVTDVPGKPSTDIQITLKP
jgi:glutamate 5-kinase